MNLKGKTVFITGASAGIGEATVMQCAAQGARLLLAARRGDKLTGVASRAFEHGAPAVHTIETIQRVRRDAASPHLSEGSLA